MTCQVALQYIGEGKTTPPPGAYSVGDRQQVCPLVTLSETLRTLSETLCFDEALECGHHFIETHELGLVFLEVSDVLPGGRNTFSTHLVAEVCAS